jgi:hypothetical protein
MSDFQTGLQVYSTLKSVFFIITFIILCCCLTWCYFYTSGKNYKLARNGRITYKHIDNSGNILDTCDINNPTPDCRYVNEYYDIQNKHYVLPQEPITNPKNLPKIGDTQFYYENSNPSNHFSSIMEPSNFVLILLCVVFVILLAAIFNLYLIRTYPEYGAVVGGIQAASDVASIFNRNTSNYSRTR